MKRSLLYCPLFLAAAAFVAAQQSNAPGSYQGTSNPPPDDSITTGAPQAGPKQKPAPGKPINSAPAAPPAAAPPGAPQTEPQSAPAPASNPAPASADGSDAGLVILKPETQPQPSSANGAPGATAAAQGNQGDGNQAEVNQGVVTVEPDSPVTPSPAKAGTPAPANGDGTDDGLVIVRKQPAESQVSKSNDPDADVVHPGPPPAGTAPAGTMIRARLLAALSTDSSRPGDRFRTRVASDVFHHDQIVIPAGAEIDGEVAAVSTGHVGEHAFLMLRPETIILPDGARYHLYAELSGAPGSRARVNDEGAVSAGSRAKKAEIEYGGGVGAGLVAGAALGGPMGALAGSIIGAGAVTLHLLLDHPQPTLHAGTVLDFSLTQPLSLVPETASQQR